MSAIRRPGAIWREIAKNLGRKPATVLYPKERFELPPNFRGRPVFIPEKCTGCNLCMRDCPSGAVKIEKIAEKTYACTFLLDRCLYCGQCADSCTRKAIVMSQEYELATLNKETLFPRQEGTPPEAKEAKSSTDEAETDEGCGPTDG